MDLVWARLAISALTLAAFGLSTAGLVLIRRDAGRAVVRLERERRLRSQYSAELHAVISRAGVTSEEKDAARLRWRQQHDGAGMYVTTWDTIGEEPLAERVIVELREGSRLDFWLVGAGLSCGLAASIWGTWLP